MATECENKTFIVIFTDFSLVSSVYCEERRARGLGGTGKTIFTSVKQLTVLLKANFYCHTLQ